MAVTRTDLFLMAQRIIAALNAGTASAFTATLADQRRSLGEVVRAVIAADTQVCLAIAEIQGHGYRSLFLADSTDISHGGVIPDHVGPVEAVRIKHLSGDADYKAGRYDRFVTLADIENWRKNPLDLYGAAGYDEAESPLTGWYVAQGSQIFHTGYAARVQIANVARTVRQVTDGVTTSGQKDFDSAGASFTDADIGAVVLLSAAGTGGVPFIARLDSRSSGTKMLMSEAAGASGTAQIALIAKGQAPEVFEDVVFGLALGNLFKEGDAGSSALVIADARAHLGLIRAGAMFVPPLQREQAA